MDNYTTIGPSDQDSNLLISIFLNFLENFNIGLLVIVFKEKRRKLKTFVKYILLEYQKKEEIFVDQRTLLLTMSEAESFHDVVEDEVHFKEDEPRVESSSPPTPITSNDMDVIIEGWEVKFEQISRCLREVQLASEKASSEMFSMTRDGRARENLQERRIEAMHVGLTEFLERCDPAHLAASRPLDAPTASTPYTPSMPTGYRPDYVRTSDFQPSPVSQDKSTEPARSTDSHI